MDAPSSNFIFKFTKFIINIEFSITIGFNFNFHIYTSLSYTFLRYKFSSISEMSIWATVYYPTRLWSLQSFPISCNLCDFLRSLAIFAISCNRWNLCDLLRSLRSIWFQSRLISIYCDLSSVKLFDFNFSEFNGLTDWYQFFKIAVES